MIVQNKEIRESKIKPLGISTPIDPSKPFGERLRAAREARGITRGELALRLKGYLSEDGIRALETGRAMNPHPGTLAWLIQYLPELSSKNDTNNDGNGINAPQVSRRTILSPM